MPLQVVQGQSIKLEALGDPTAAACEGDYCEIPEHHTQAVINRKLDEDAV